MSPRRSSAIGTSSSAERILRVRCTSVGRSSVSRFTRWLETLDGGATFCTIVRLSVSAYPRASVSLCNRVGIVPLTSKPPPGPSVTVLDTERPPTLTVAGRSLLPTAAFGSYWALAAERQAIFFRRLRGQQPPWTTDPVLATNRFTNAYRASDRVSQYLINQVVYGAPSDERSTVLRVLLFKIFNRIETWRCLEDAVGHIAVDTFDVAYIAKLLDERMAAGERLYSAAYIMPNPKLGETRKHANHLRLLEELLVDGTMDRLIEAASLRELYEVL